MLNLKKFGLQPLMNWLTRVFRPLVPLACMLFASSYDWFSLRYFVFVIDQMPLLWFWLYVSYFEKFCIPYVTWGLFLVGPETFSGPESYNKIQIKVTSMQSLMPIHCFLFEIQNIKNGFAGPASYRVFRETGPWSGRVRGPLCRSLLRCNFTA